MLNQTNLWSFAIPHEDSGPCYTYNPPYESDPGYQNSIFLVVNFEDWVEDLDIFLHEKGKFFFQDGWTTDTIRLDQSKLRSVDTGHPRVKGNLKKENIEFFICKTIGHNGNQCLKSYFNAFQ